MLSASKSHRVFINSLPKSGTHLVIKAVEQLGYREHFAGKASQLEVPGTAPMFINFREVRDALQRDGGTLLPPSMDAIAVGTLAPIYVGIPDVSRWFTSLGPGEFIMGHALFTPVLQPLLDALQVKHLFILRDPRAVVVSLMDFICNTRGMPHPHFLQDDFEPLSLMDRLKFLIEGGNAPRAGLHTQPFAAVYQSMLEWQLVPGCQVLRFEDLVGPRGGGDERRQLEAFERIAAHLEEPVVGEPTEQARARVEAIFDPSARTFRVGRIGGWDAQLDDKSRAYLNAACEPLCHAAGYII